MVRAFGFSAALALISSLSSVSATCYGPDACLEGWVWRQAIPSDHVCVTPAVRTQTAQDNAAAASRVNPSGGPFGVNTCLNGYVWREAYSGDVVCVLPATRTEAANDNAQANNRVASLVTWANTWNPGPDTYPYIKVNGENFNFGSVQVAIFDNGGGLIQGWTTVTAGIHGGYIGGSWGWESTINDCSANIAPSASKNSYAIAQDVTSGCFSAKIPVEICYNL